MLLPNQLGMASSAFVSQTNKADFPFAKDSQVLLMSAGMACGVM